jgi:hypothetical protein
MSPRHWKPRYQTGTRRGAFVIALLFGGAIALIVHAASPPVTSSFEIDQDATDLNAQAGDDWNTLLAGGGSAGAFVFDSDPINSSLDDNFSQGGSKDERDVSSAGITKTYWLNTQTTPPDKDDIEHAFAASYNQAGTGDLLIYFGADRFSNSGDSAIGFWFFQKEVSDNNNSGVFSGKHTVGDILVTSDFRQGGGVGVINVFEWIGNQAGGPLKLLVSQALANGQTVPDVFCNSAIAGKFDAGVVCATSNRSPKLVPLDWTDGFVFKGTGPTTQFPTGTFFEGGVNITALFAGQSLPCFTSFLAMTRTSASTTAQLKDYVAGSFPVCGIEVGKACDADHAPTVNSDGNSIHTTFSVPIHNTGSSTVYSVQLIEDGLDATAYPGNQSCAITALNGSAITPRTLSATSGQDVVSTLAAGATVTATVECNSTDNPMTNKVTATASTSASAGGTLLSADHATSTEETCHINVNPSLSVTKECALPVTINPTTLKPHVCANIVVTNTSSEQLVNGSVSDDKIGTLSSNFTLAPGGVLTLNNKCYDTLVQDDPDNTLPHDAMFSDKVTASATGALSKASTGDVTADAHCPLCPD